MQRPRVQLNRSETKRILAENFSDDKFTHLSIDGTISEEVLQHELAISQGRNESVMKGPKIANSILELIGRTPMVRMNHCARERGVVANIILKLESMEPCSSVKDRIAKTMIEEAERRGDISPGKTLLIEPTSGNTGIGMAMVCASKGYDLILVMPSSMSMERRVMVKALGAKVLLTPADKGVSGAVAKAKQIAQFLGPNTMILDQFNNKDNLKCHLETTGPEIWEQTDGKIDILIGGVGTGGTLSGIAKFIKSRNSNTKIVAVEPFESAVLSGGKPGPHKIQGIGTGFIPGNFFADYVDEILPISSDQAVATSKRVAIYEGIFCGISSGAAMEAAMIVGCRPENAGKNIVVMIPSFGERYLSSVMFKDLQEEAIYQPIATMDEPDSFESVMKLLGASAMHQRLDEHGNNVAVLSNGNIPASQLLAGLADQSEQVKDHVEARPHPLIPQESKLLLPSLLTAESPLFSIVQSSRLNSIEPIEERELPTVHLTVDNVKHAVWDSTRAEFKPDEEAEAEDSNKLTNKDSNTSFGEVDAVDRATLELFRVRRNIRMMELELDPMVVKILDYWFKDTLEECLVLWFGKDEETDQYIAHHFKESVLLASQGKLNHWVTKPLECLALVILLDQFPRNIFRFLPEMYSCDPVAIGVVMRGIFYGYPRKMTKIEACFFCLVLTHSENMHHQLLCMDLWKSITTTVKEGDPLKKFDEIFRKHVEVIEHFGRFPHRNKILRRPDTVLEKAFLEDVNFRFDMPLLPDATGFQASAEFEKRGESDRYDWDFTL